MASDITLTQEELALLERLLRNDLGNGRSEHRRTRNPEFRDKVADRLQMEQRIIQEIERSRNRATGMRASPFPG